MEFRCSEFFYGILYLFEFKRKRKKKHFFSVNHGKGQNIKRVLC